MTATKLQYCRAAIFAAGTTPTLRALKHTTLRSWNG